MNKFLKEILEQPDALEKTLKYYTEDEGAGALERIKETLGKRHFEQILFTGMGSSYFTSFAAAGLFGSSGIGASVVNTSELLHYQLPRLGEKTLLFCISQSGESYEIVELMKKMPQGVFCVGITNERNSTLAQKADAVLLSKAGPEEMTSTKTYISILLVVYIMGWYLAGQWNRQKIESVKLLAGFIREDLTQYEKGIKNALEFMGALPNLQIIARGPAFATALQSSLMFKEAVKVPAAGYLGGEFRHGPMEMVQEGTKCILFASKGKTLKQSLKMAQDIAGFGGRVLLITNAPVDFSHENIMIMPVRSADEYLFSIESVVPVQLFIDMFAKEKGFEAGSFSHGAKVTTVE